MEQPETFIARADLVISRFGEWPGFHDAEVMKLELHREGRILLLELKAFQMLKETDEKGYFKIQNLSLITFRFAGIEDLRLEGFNGQNAIFGLNFERDGVKIRVSLEPAHGLGGEFLCETVEVVQVKSISNEVEKTYNS